MGLGVGVGVGLGRGVAPAARTPADLPAGVLLAWFRGRGLDDLAALSDGTGTVTGADDSSTVGHWTDRAAGKHAVQATASSRPIAGYSSLGRGLAVFGDGTADQLAAASSIAGAQHVFAAVSFVSPDAARAGGDEVAAFTGAYQAYVSGNAVSNPSSALLVGDTGTSRLLTSGNLAGDYYRNGTLTSPADVGRQRVRQVARYSRSVAMDTGAVRLLVYATDATPLRAYGALHEVVILSSTASAADLAATQAYMDWHRATPVVCCTLDSLTACLYLDDYDAWPALLWRQRYRGCVSVANRGIPSRLVETATADDPAVLDSIQGTGRNIVVLLGGANDVLAGASAATVWSRLQAYITMATARGWQVVVCSVPDGTGYSAPQRAVLSTLRGLIAAGYLAAGASGYVDLWATAPSLQGDGIHFDAAGAAAVADAVGAVLDTLL